MFQIAVHVKLKKFLYRYCSNDDGDDCTLGTARSRIGINDAYGLEDMFYDYGVDIQIEAHEHSYERTFPVYQNQVRNGSVEAYTDPGAPVHVQYMRQQSYLKPNFIKFFFI